MKLKQTNYYVVDQFGILHIVHSIEQYAKLAQQLREN